MEIKFYKKVKEIIKKDPRYKIEAYEFVMLALFYTQKKLKRQGHIRGKELLEGIKECGVEQFGLLVQTVLKHWGIKKTGDFGEIVFNLINYGLLKKTEEDSIEDFKGVYEFRNTFEEEHRRKFLEEIRREFSISNDFGQKDDKKI